MSNKFDDAFEKGHGIEFDAFRFDEPDYNALIVTEENFLEMLRVQPAGVAYYGTLAKKCESEYDELEKRWKARYAELYEKTSSWLRYQCEKDTQKNVESAMSTKHGAEIEEWREKLKELRAKRDGTAMYFEGWKAKGPVLAAMKELVAAGLLRIDETIRESDVQKVQEKKMKVSEASSILDKHARFLGNK